MISLASVVDCCPMDMISPPMKLFKVKTSNITIVIHANMKFCRNEVLFSDSPYLQVGYTHVVWSRYFSESLTIWLWWCWCQSDWLELLESIIRSDFVIITYASVQICFSLQNQNEWLIRAIPVNLIGISVITVISLMIPRSISTTQHVYNQLVSMESN